MMSILIKGAEMPEGDAVLCVAILPSGEVFSRYQNNETGEYRLCRPGEDMTAIPVPHKQEEPGYWIKQSVVGLCGVEYFRCPACGAEDQIQAPYCRMCGKRLKKQKEGTNDENKENH